ncbi:YibE/F family protein [Humibacter soli]
MPAAFSDPVGQPPRTATGPRRTVLVVLGVLGVLTIVGLVLLWPNYTSVQKASSHAHYAAQGTTFVNASVEAIQSNCPGFTSPTTSSATGPGDSRACQLAKVKVLSGSSKGIQITLPVLWPYSKGDLSVGDQVQLMQSHTGSAEAAQSDAQNGTIGAGNGSSFTVAGIVRNQPILWWVLAFVVVVAAVGALRGILSLVALAFAGATFVFFTLPALISGSSGLAVGIVSAAAIMFVVIYLAHGLSIRSSVALLGTLTGVALTAGISQWMLATTHLTGVPDDTTGNISVITTAIDFRGLLSCAIIIAGLGALNDITITQTSAVWELRTAAPTMSRGELFTAAMRIGRDHIASTIYTIVFAYAGTALAVLVTIYLYNRPVGLLLSGDDIATEVVRTLCSSIGLILAMPATTALAVFMLPAQRRRRVRDVSPAPQDQDAGAPRVDIVTVPHVGLYDA